MGCVDYQADGSKSSDWSFDGSSWPVRHSTSSVCDIKTTYFAQGDTILQNSVVSNTSDEPVQYTVTVSGPVSLHRAAYTQLTPQGDLSMPPCLNQVSTGTDGTLHISNPHLPANLVLALHVDGRLQPFPPTSQSSADPVDVALQSSLLIDPGKSSIITLQIVIDPGSTTAKHALAPLSTFAPSSFVQAIDPSRLASLLGGGARGSQLAYVVLRNIDYLLGCCTVPLGEKGTCIITDHQCLPLGWNRDN